MFGFWDSPGVPDSGHLPIEKRSLGLQAKEELRKLKQHFSSKNIVKSRKPRNEQWTSILKMAERDEKEC